MGKLHDHIDDDLAAWIHRQRVFFVATAPLSPDGHVNCSPKGGDAFRVLGPHTVAYQDLTGSGVETIAHLRENGRIVIMFCAFEGPPSIVRLHGRGDALTPDHPKFASLRKHFPDHAGTRAIIRVHVTRVSDSCGFGVPLFDHRCDRDALDTWAESKGPEKLQEYRRAKNARSVDGLAGLE
ncbi:MAG TPA: pyridoxamine 5'-phosphate oxidase family protein [Nitrospiria bacterium]|nr:pyridoxamine 5'-phosphate oxidase family protein [Nitrospiria bacterium]